MLDYRSVFFLLGVLLSGLSVAMAIPTVCDLLFYGGIAWASFGVSTFFCGTIGVAITLAYQPNGRIALGTREAFLITALSWIFLCLFASLPFYFQKSLRLTFASGVFEAVSGLTTTGATVIDKLDRAPRAILLWRAMLQWFGGTGIIVMAMTIFPTLRIGGMPLFHSEFSDRSEKILPRLSQIATAILMTYTFFTALCFVLFVLAGMPCFDALCHAMSTVSTGGFSTKDASLSFYNNVGIEIIALVFMIIGGSTLMMYVRFFNGDHQILWRDRQFRAYLIVLAIICIFMVLGLFMTEKMSLAQSIRNGFFTAVSTITTTGFTVSSYESWGYFPQMILLFAALIGGCSGSTTGGIKIFRFQILLKLAHTHLQAIRRPHGLFVPSFEGHKIDSFLAISVFTFLMLYVMVLVILSCLLSIIGWDMLASFSGAIAFLGNVGVGTGKVIGMSPTFAQISDSAKYILMLGMILGRLEILTVLILFMPSFWKN